MMSHFQYSLISDAPTVTLEGAAANEQEARREAISFLADLLRDLAMGDGEGSRLRVEARARDGKLVCAVAANLEL